MADSPRQTWKRFKDSIKKSDFDPKRFKEDFGPTLDEVEDLVESLEKNRAKLKDLIKEANRIADKYDGTIDDMIRECARDEARKDRLYDLRGILNLLRAWLKGQEKAELS